MKKRLSLLESITVFLLVGLIVSLALYSGWNLGYRGRGLNPFNSIKQGKEMADFERVLNLIKENYDGQFNESASVDDSIEKLVDNLGDSHSYYVSKNDYRLLIKEEKGEFVGIGIIYDFENHFPVIVAVLPGSPAELIGLKPGDKIVQINDVDVETLNNEVEVMNRLGGKEGDVVKIKLFDKSRDRVYIVARAKFTSPDIIYHKLEDGISYMRIYQFGPRLKSEFQDISSSLKINQVKKLIIDLRNNIGGDTESAVFLADQFINQGIIVKEIDKKNNQEKVQMTTGTASFKDWKIAVLVNKRTASAAEILAAAIKDSGRGKLIGERTKGKGTEQAFFELQDGSAIYLTVGKWLTPKGEWINEKGIVPDLEIVDNHINESVFIEKARESL